MELYLQMGHGMQSLAKEMLQLWKKGTIILSPVNMKQERIVSFAKEIKDINGRVLFDPQLFYPKNGHGKLRAYDYWPNEYSTISDNGTIENINREILKINYEINSSDIILPCKEIKEDTLIDNLNWLDKSVEYFRKKTDKTLFATLCVSADVLRNNEFIEHFIEQLRHVDIDGYYIIPQPPNNEYLVSDYLWMIGVMKLISCLKLQRKKIIVGYSNHQGLIYALAHADAIASGTYLNTRSFAPKRFKMIEENTMKQRSTWYYLPTAFSEYKAALLDVAMQRGYLDEFKPQGDYRNSYSKMLFSGAQPSSTGYKETNSFKHYLYCLKIQCEMLSSDDYSKLYDLYDFTLNLVDNKIKMIKKLGIASQNRDFSQVLDVNRIAMCANDTDYGFKLKMEWKNL